MFTAWILLMLNSLFFTLRLSGGGSGSFPRPLKAEEERMYLERMAQGDLEARNILIEHNLRLVAHIMKKYYTPNGDQDDLISIGTIGLIKAVTTFNPQKASRLSTYAARCIENELLMYFRAKKKHSKEVSLYEPIGTDKEGNEINLLDVIEKLNVSMQEQFNTKFKEIQVMFDKVFKELFGGGRGALELVDDTNLLETGIRIIAQPPGKKLQNMMQLSGGEKALTAIALLFAIQNLKPSPFCLLDEIEAALDDSNVGRFAKYLHKLTKSTQFIVITHRRGTMAAADRLYGITMQEKGVSTLVSVNLIENDLDK